MWAIGAVLSWLVLRDCLQGTLAALLVPAWIASEWSVGAQHFSGRERILVQFLAMATVTYLSARRDKDQEDSYFRRALVWSGGIALLPSFAVLAAGDREWYWNGRLPPMSFSLHAAGWVMAFVLPLLAAWLLCGKAILWNLGFALWIFLVGFLDQRLTTSSSTDRPNR